MVLPAGSWRCVARGLLLGALVACQNYDFEFQPDANRVAARLDFTVAQPSKADILFVIDNSQSMRDEQEALTRAVDTLLDVLAPLDTRYRIGIVSTDTVGFVDDCAGDPFPAGQEYPPVFGDRHGAHGDCTRPEVLLRRPHDGARGRLIAAYDPQVFSASNFAALSPEHQAALATLLPTAAYSTSSPDDNGPRWVIDREEIEARALVACGCSACDPTEPVMQACTQTVTRALVMAYFKANMHGLGIGGLGWEQGIKAALLAVGIAPEESSDAVALNPAQSLTAAIGAPNRISATTSIDADAASSWLRDDATLAVMFVTDEEDCSMPTLLFDMRTQYEATAGRPEGSICYQSTAQADFLAVQRLAQLLVQKKGNVASRVAIGFIGGVRKAGAVGDEGRSGVPTDCVAAAAAVPDTACSCLRDAPAGWCNYSQDTSGASSGLPACDALAGKRYYQFAQLFTRHTYESICRNDTAAFGAALADFARLATLPCFQLDASVQPPGSTPQEFIEVWRRPKETPQERLLLERQEGLNPSAGWYYDSRDNRLCLNGIDRVVGDSYEIFVLHTDDVDMTR